MKIRKINNKKAVSPMIAYVLLIVISLSIAGLVYTWLKVQIPRQVEKCPEDVRIILTEKTCLDGGKVGLTFENKGLFDIDGAYIKYSDNQNDELPTMNLSLADAHNGLSKAGFLYFGASVPRPITPGRDYSQNFSYIDSAQGTNSIKKIMVQPFILSEDSEIVLCENSITDSVDCP